MDYIDFLQFIADNKISITWDKSPIECVVDCNVEYGSGKSEMISFKSKQFLDNEPLVNVLVRALLAAKNFIEGG